MKLIHTLLLIILFLGLGCKPKTGEALLKKEGLPVMTKEADCPYQLFICQGVIPEKGTTFFKGNEISQVKLIIEKSIYTKDPLRVDEANLKRVINNNYPYKTMRGICSLDWEGEAFKILINADVNSKEFKMVLNEYLKALRIAKRMRPNVKWGYYGIPDQNYWHRNEVWRKRTFDLLPIFKESDVIFPSVYDFYEDAVASRKQDAAYVNDNVVLALEVGTLVDKPVLPFVWHRYHNSNPKVGFSMIPADEFKDHVDAALKATYKGKHIDGLIWWGADRWFHNNTNNKVLKKEASKSRNFDSYQNKVLVDYTQLIYELFEENCN